MSADKELERQRYDRRAQSMLSKLGGNEGSSLPTHQDISPALRTPYVHYIDNLKELSPGAGGAVLEIGAGNGIYTGVLLETKAGVFATDISENSVSVIRKRYADSTLLYPGVVDMEALPFSEGTFSLVTSAGSLSYGDGETVLNEIYRVLRPGGSFVCVDSLNHNPLYRLNRYIQYLRGRRSHSTLLQMPTCRLLRKYEKKFQSVKVQFFGSVVWLIPLLTPVLGDQLAATFIESVDRCVKVKKSAFKFLMVAKK